MDYLKVALRTDLAAEDMSQVAPRAIVHLIGALSRETFCGKATVRDLAHAGTDRVVSCSDCISTARLERESPADNTSLNEPASRILRHVSGPDYSGIERRSRPRFIHHAVPTTGEAMKHYTNVSRPDETTIHVLFDGDIATACGAISTPELTPAPQGKVVSCDACTKAILNQQRASDHRIAVELTQAMQASGDADLLDKLRQMCGYVENGSSEYVTIGQDDATREWTISIGDSYARNMGKARRYNGSSFHQAIRNAAEKEIQIEEPQAHGYADQDAAPAPVVSLDAVVEANRKLLLDRSNVGIQKYGVTLEKSGLTQREIVQHAIEEALDLANYLQTFLQHPAAQ